jgi:hypothetical protein
MVDHSATLRAVGAHDAKRGVRRHGQRAQQQYSSQHRTQCALLSSGARQ